MDQIDKNILMQLQNNAKLQTKEIANNVNLSLTPTYDRIRKLEQKEIITSYVALVDRAKIGKHIMAYCQISLTQHSKTLADAFRNHIQDMDEVMECYKVSGNYDFLLKVVVENVAELHKFINDKLSTVEGISTMHNALVLEEVKVETAYSL
jgi:DNA-binding Lrp family transcriptional regulator